MNDELTEISAYAFYNAGKKKLESITIPANVKSIGEYAFAGCDTLSTIVLGVAIDSIAGYAFQNC
ncbi:UNVERIFIED_CONTAM: leucine-rich repeat domain-containing protein, partial [Prevotella sp. 15_C9]